MTVSFQIAGLSFAPAVLFPVLTIIFLALFYIHYIKIQQPERGTTEWVEMKVAAGKRRMTLLLPRYPLTLRDILPPVVITLFFTSFTIINQSTTARIEVPKENMLPLAELLSKLPLTAAVSGVLVLPVIYVLIKNMFGKTPVATCGTLLFGFEFLRLTQSRAESADIYAVLFILLAYLFMYRLITTDPNAPFGKSLPALALSGLFFGLSVAVKWTGLFAGIGLLIIFIIRLVQLGLYAGSKDGEEKDYRYLTYFVKTLLFSLLFFIIIPAVIYYLSYIPQGLDKGMTLQGGMLWSGDYLKMFADSQAEMFKYYTTAGTATAGIATDGSAFWQWMLNLKPAIYANDVDGVTRSVTADFGNPVLYWGGFIAMGTVAVRIFTHRDGKALVILFGYLSVLLPWMIIPRTAYANEYLPATLFLVLALAHIMNTIFEREKKGRKIAVYTFTVVAGLVFCAFYPMLAGLYMPEWYYDIFVEWLPIWAF